MFLMYALCYMYEEDIHGNICMCRWVWVHVCFEYARQMHTSAVQGSHLSCHLESPCQKPGYHPQEVGPHYACSLPSIYESARKKTLIYSWAESVCFVWHIWNVFSIFDVLVRRHLLGGVIQPPAADLPEKGISKNVVVSNDMWSKLACSGMMTTLSRGSWGPHKGQVAPSSNSGSPIYINNDIKFITSFMTKKKELTVK